VCFGRRKEASVAYLKPAGASLRPLYEATSSGSTVFTPHCTPTPTAATTARHEANKDPLRFLGRPRQRCVSTKNCEGERHPYCPTSAYPSLHPSLLPARPSRPSPSPITTTSRQCVDLNLCQHRLCNPSLPIRPARTPSLPPLPSPVPTSSLPPPRTPLSSLLPPPAPRILLCQSRP